jgi:hypothetical protein
MLASLTPERPFHECLAGEIMMRALTLRPHTAATEESCDRLEREFLRIYSSPPPTRHRVFLPRYAPPPWPEVGDEPLLNLT